MTISDSGPPSTASHPANLIAGSRVGPYEVDGLIAAGGLGQVYQACDTRVNRKVALRLLAPSVTTDAERLARFELDARTTALVNHPNIVSVYDVGSHQGMPFVASELLQGSTLRARLCDGALPVRTSMTYALEIARGLVAAHDLGVVHRDLKPQNIFITQDGRVKILDFGLATCRNETLGLPQERSTSTRPETLVDTVGYMSPERVRGLETDARSDIFSLGVILHEMVTGVAPFHAESPIDTLHKILGDDAPAVAPREGLSSPELQHVIRHCLEKDPEARFQSARDLAFVLTIALRSAERTESRAPESRGLLYSLFGLLF